MAFVSTHETGDKARESEREADVDVIARLDRFAREAVNHKISCDWRNYAERAFRYHEGEMPPEMRAALKKRNQPEVLENRIKPQIDKLLGTYKQLRTRTTFVGRNAPVDDRTAATFSDLDRFIDQQTKFRFEEGRTVKDDFIAGVGWLEWGEEKDAQGRSRIFGRYEDNAHMWLDPFSRRYDPNDDARYLIRAKWMDLENGIAMWPEKEKQLRQCVMLTSLPSGANILALDPKWLQEAEGFYVQSQRQRLRPFEVWYKRKAIRKAVITENGVRIDLEFLGTRQAQQVATELDLPVVTSMVDEMWLGIFCGGVLIHHDRSPYQHGHFPFVPYYAYRKKNGQPVGWVSDAMMSLQDEDTKRKSKALHLFTTQKAVFTKNAIEDRDELAREMASPDGQIEIRTGKLDQFRIESNVEMGQAQFAMYTLNRQAFDEGAGQGPVDFGQAPGDVRSDRGLARLQSASNSIRAELFENIQESRRMGQWLKFELVKQFFDDDMIVQVTDEPKGVRAVQITKDQLQAVKQRDMDFVIVEENDFATSRQQQIELFSQILPQLTQFPAFAQVFLEMTDLRDKERLQQLIQAASQPRAPEPKINLTLDWPSMTAEEKVAWSLQLNMQDMAQLLAQAGPVSKQELAARVEQFKQQSKEKMEFERIDLKRDELGVKDNRQSQKLRLDALTIQEQETTKRTQRANEKRSES